MKKLLIGAAALAAVAGYGLAANAADQVINLSGTVSSFCTINGSATPADITPSFPTVTDGNVPNGVSTDISIGQVVCNTASLVKLTSLNGAAITSPFVAAPSGFQNYVNYTASVSSPAPVTLNANSTSGTAATLFQQNTSGGASVGNVDVTLTAVGTSAPLVAGTYSDVLTISITPTT
jgi:hypothetical protein